MHTQPFPLARVILFTADACLTADLATGGERVQEALNAPSAILELTRLSYANPDRPDIPIVEYPAGALRKNEVGCVAVLAEPPQTTIRKFGTYVQKRPVRISVLIPGMVVVGTCHVQGRYDPTILLKDDSESFIPLTNAGVVRARTTMPTSVPPERMTIFVNRSHISGILLAESAETAFATGQLSPDRLPAAPPLSISSVRELRAVPPGVQSPSHTGRLRRLSSTDSEW